VKVPIPYAILSEGTRFQSFFHMLNAYTYITQLKSSPYRRIGREYLLAKILVKV
jgi:hypothetical protein